MEKLKKLPINQRLVMVIAIIEQRKNEAEEVTKQSVAGYGSRHTEVRLCR